MSDDKELEEEQTTETQTPPPPPSEEEEIVLPRFWDNSGDSKPEPREDTGGDEAYARRLKEVDVYLSNLETKKKRGDSEWDEDEKTEENFWSETGAYFRNINAFTTPVWHGLKRAKFEISEFFADEPTKPFNLKEALDEAQIPEEDRLLFRGVESASHFKYVYDMIKEEREDARTWAETSLTKKILLMGSDIFLWGWAGKGAGFLASKLPLLKNTSTVAGIIENLVPKKAAAQVLLSLGKGAAKGAAAGAAIGTTEYISKYTSTTDDITRDTLLLAGLGTVIPLTTEAIPGIYKFLNNYDPKSVYGQWVMEEVWAPIAKTIQATGRGVKKPLDKIAQWAAPGIQKTAEYFMAKNSLTRNVAYQMAFDVSEMSPTLARFVPRVVNFNPDIIRSSWGADSAEARINFFNAKKCSQYSEYLDKLDAISGEIEDYTLKTTGEKLSARALATEGYYKGFVDSAVPHSEVFNTIIKAMQKDYTDLTNESLEITGNLSEFKNTFLPAESLANFDPAINARRVLEKQMTEGKNSKAKMWYTKRFYDKTAILEDAEKDGKFIKILQKDAINQFQEKEIAKRLEQYKDSGKSAESISDIVLREVDDVTAWYTSAAPKYMVFNETLGKMVPRYIDSAQRKYDNLLLDIDSGGSEGVFRAAREIRVEDTALLPFMEKDAVSSLLSHLMNQNSNLRMQEAAILAGQETRQAKWMELESIKAAAGIEKKEGALTNLKENEQKALFDKYAVGGQEDPIEALKGIIKEEIKTYFAKKLPDSTIEKAEKIITKEEDYINKSVDLFFDVVQNKKSPGSTGISTWPMVKALRNWFYACSLGKTGISSFTDPKTLIWRYNLVPTFVGFCEQAPHVFGKIKAKLGYDREKINDFLASVELGCNTTLRNLTVKKGLEMAQYVPRRKEILDRSERAVDWTVKYSGAPIIEEMMRRSAGYLRLRELLKEEATLKKWGTSKEEVLKALETGELPERVERELFTEAQRMSSYPGLTSYPKWTYYPWGSIFTAFKSWSFANTSSYLYPALMNIGSPSHRHFAASLAYTYFVQAVKTYCRAELNNKPYDYKKKEDIHSFLDAFFAMETAENSLDDISGVLGMPYALVQDSYRRWTRSFWQVLANQAALPTYLGREVAAAGSVIKTMYPETKDWLPSWLGFQQSAPRLKKSIRTLFRVVPQNNNPIADPIFDYFSGYIAKKIKPPKKRKTKRKTKRRQQ